MKSSRWILGLVTLTLVLTGCPEKRRPAGSVTAKPTPSAAADDDKKTEATGPLAEYGRNLMNAEKKAVEVTALATLQQAVSHFNVIEGRFPRTLEELVAMRYVAKLPPAPRGKRFTYDPGKGEVKALDLAPATDAPQAPAPEAPASEVPAAAAPALLSVESTDTAPIAE